MVDELKRSGYMQDLQKVMNKKIVRKILNHYASKGERRIDELFGEEREKTIGAFRCIFRENTYTVYNEPGYEPNGCQR
jgi:hypothetical protein